MPNGIWLFYHFIDCECIIHAKCISNAFSVSICICKLALTTIPCYDKMYSKISGSWQNEREAGEPCLGKDRNGGCHRGRQQEPHPGHSWDWSGFQSSSATRNASDSKHFLPFCLLPSFRVLGIKDIWLSFWLGSSCPSSCIVSGVGKTYIWTSSFP